MDVRSITDDGSVHYGAKVGNCYLVAGRKQSHFPYHIMYSELLVSFPLTIVLMEQVGPHWLWMMVTYALVIVPTVLFLNNIAVLWGTPLVAITALILVGTLWFLSSAALSDPGIVYKSVPPLSPIVRTAHVGVCCSTRSITPYEIPSGPSTTDEIQDVESGGVKDHLKVVSAAITPLPIVQVPTMRCEACDIDRPLNASHCYECGVCIVNLDHHCPWTGKCVGEKTKKSLDRFVGMLAVLVLFVLLMVVISHMHDHYLFDFSNEEHF